MYKTDATCKEMAQHVETIFNTSNYEIERPLPKGKIEKVIGLAKDELGLKIMIKFVGRRAKTYSYLIDNRRKDKKANDTKKCVIKIKLKFENNKR